MVAERPAPAQRQYGRRSSEHCPGSAVERRRRWVVIANIFGQAMVQTMFDAMRSNYDRSVRRAILDYILRWGRRIRRRPPRCEPIAVDRSSEERARLDIPSPPARAVPDWGAGRSLPSPPLEWRQTVQQAWLYLNGNLCIGQFIVISSGTRPNTPIDRNVGRGNRRRPCLVFVVCRLSALR